MDLQPPRTYPYLALHYSGGIIVARLHLPTVSYITLLRKTLSSGHKDYAPYNLMISRG